MLQYCNQNGGAVPQRVGDWYLPAYGGQFGRRGMQEFLKANTAHCRMLKMNGKLLFYMWFKEHYVEEAESQVDILRSL